MPRRWRIKQTVPFFAYARRVDVHRACAGPRQGRICKKDRACLEVRIDMRMSLVRATQTLTSLYTIDAKRLVWWAQLCGCTPTHPPTYPPTHPPTQPNPTQPNPTPPHPTPPRPAPPHPREAGRQAGRQADRQTDRRTDRQRDSRNCGTSQTKAA